MSNVTKVIIVRGMMNQTWLNHAQLNTTRVSLKKYGVADDRYFKNGNTQQCNIFRHNKYNFCLAVCDISTPEI